MPAPISRRAAAALRGYVASRRDKMLDLARRLVAVESPSGDFEGSSAVVDLLAQEARATPGVTSVERVLSPGYGEHLRVRLFGEGRERRARATLLLGHTDTVHPLGSTRERPWREDGGRVYAPGIFDMKANCALIFYAVRGCAALRMSPERPVVILLTCDEETGGGTGRALVEEEARRAAQVLVLEPPAPGGRVKTERKGVGWWTLKARSRVAHAGPEAEPGASAALEIARQIGRLDALNSPARGTTVNVGLVSGGARAGAAEAQAAIDVRFSTTAEAVRVEESIRGLRPFDERVGLTVEGGISCPPLERTEAVSRLYEHAWLIASAVGFELGEAQVGGASDGNIAAGVGAAVLDGLGIDGDGAHAAHEHIVASDIPRRGALLAGLIATL